ncbi:MAG: UvrD-helicase domain-containing protein [Muribaculaceae bacterium]|nr:UvrD-helicase domain-containing protein [Muribaculaceae bacterium]
MQNQEPDYSYLDLLNPQQRAAVTYSDGPALVIAGAGSGKTRVLTYKIVDLLQHGYEPYRILALTFTNKAAREMKERIRGIVGERTASRLWMGTFHSIFLRILRAHAEQLGFKRTFTIYDSADSRSLIKSIVKDLGLDEKIYKPATLASVISNAKNALVSAEQYALDPSFQLADRQARRPMTARIFSLYTERCRRADAMDFDDILYFMNILLRDFPDVRRHYSDFFRYILVDEYQDTNFAQHLIISQLAGEDNRICVVGDDAQSIYSFRGANITNILNLEKRYPGLKIFKLERNYRSTQNIINAAGSLISKNTRQIPKNVYSENDKGDPVRIVRTYSDMEEAYLVANLISRSKLTFHDSLDDYAILYRTNAQSRVLEESLRKRNIPYRIYGGLSFYQRKEIKDAIGYFRLSVNPDDDEALRRVINYPARGIGETTMKKLQAAAMEAGVSLWSVISSPGEYNLGVNAGTLRKLDAFRELIDLFVKENMSGQDAYSVGQLVFNRTGILVALAHDKTPESISKQENLAELLSGLKDFVELRAQTGESDTGMAAFLSEVMLATDQDEKEDTPEPKVTLMTAHAAKGLEFKHVYIVGVEEELFPSALSMDSPAEVEEERRLLYVAITRAKETCTMTYAGSRFRNGQTVISRPSRFLSEIDTRFIKVQSSGVMNDDGRNFINPVDNYRSGSDIRRSHDKVTPPGFTSRPRVAASSPASTPTAQHTAAELRSGMRIRHGRFGEGEIVAVSSFSGEDTITVQFDQSGEKKLLLKFARFDIL